MRTSTLRFTTTLLLIILVSLTVNGQSRIGALKGRITDSIDNRGLASATINVLDAADSSLVAFTRSKEDGSFSLAKLPEGKLLFSVSYTGFERFFKLITIKSSDPIIDLGNIGMLSTSTLKDVEITAQPVVIRGDTIEFNAGSFKVNKPNAVVEDLLKKLPGVEVDKDGKITANGQEVKRILVDGKQFFADDPKLASKNLQADMVNKVQLFDKKSDKSEFTGFDDGNAEPTINLTLKADKRTGVFGKVSAGGGTDAHYQANANVNSFKKGQQLSFIGQANDINQQGFSLMDALSFSGGGPGGMGGFSGAGGGQGITATQAAGLNYNLFKTNNLDFTSSYFFNGTQNNNTSNTLRQSFIGDSTQTYQEPASSSRKNFNHRINFGIDWKLDSFNSIKITPSFSYQNTNNFSEKTFNTVGPKGGLLSDGNNLSESDSRGYNLNVTALYRHKFARAGRTFSTELRFGNNSSDADGYQYTENNRYAGGSNPSRLDTLRQQSKTLADAGSYAATISYTEPMSRRSLLEFSAYYNHNDSRNDRKTYDFNKITQDYDLENQRLTNLFDNDYNNMGAGINYRENRTGWNYAFGAKLQQSELKSILQGKTEPISQKFVNVLPNAQLQISKNRYRNFRVNYTGSPTQPSVTQLQPLEDISDPLNIKTGNPDLKQAFTNNLRINYNSFDPYTQKSFFASLTGRQTFNAIVNNDSITSFGGRYTTYNNVNGVYNINANATIGFPVKFGNTSANINLSTNGGYSNNINLLNKKENKINNLNLSERVSINYNFKELFDISLGGGVNWTKARYSQQASQNTNYFTYSGNFDFNLYLPGSLVFGTTFDYTANAGRADGYNNRFSLWNASLAKTFLKSKKAEIRISVNDILNQNTGITRNSTGNYVEDISYTVLKRYAMLTFTYNLSKFASGMGGGGGGPRMMIMRGM